MSIAARPGALESIVDWVGKFPVGCLPNEVSAIAKDLLADAIGCAVIGSVEPVVAMVKEAVWRTGGSGESTVIGESRRVGLHDAILINGTMVRAQDYNDAYVKGDMVGHPSDNIAALLAVAELSGASGRRLLSAIVLCYEIYCRLIDQLRPDADWDHTAVSAVALPLSAGWLLGLDQAALRAALSLAASFVRPSSEVRRGQLSPAKSVANAVVAAAACQLSYLAASGLAGPGGGLDGAAGWLNTVGEGVDIRAVTAEPPGRYRVADVSIKAFPCIGTAQGAVAAAIAARPDFLALDRDSARVHVELPYNTLVAGQLKDADRWHPATRETADHSIPYLVAVALVEGAVNTRQYDRRMWEDPRVRAVMGRLSVTAEEGTALGPTGARVTLWDASGRARCTELGAAPGHPDNPIRGTALKDRVLASIGSAWSRARGLEILSCVDSIEQQDSVQPLMALLADNG